jgi:hypothetical protein
VAGGEWQVVSGKWQVASGKWGVEMPRIAIVFGGLLVLEGAGFYVGTGRESWTALIPAFVGLPIVLLGALALRSGARKHAMHAAAALALLGLLAAAGRLFSQGSYDFTASAPLSQLIMAVLCGVFFALCVKSFVDARRCRAQNE